jgi:glycosyltransferase involved in cell wall biosynthesis
MEHPTIAISVIVPVYNAEITVRRCIDSILAQSFVDFELLLVNDGSTDNSSNILDGYASIDSRIKVFHKKNGGVSSARNMGIYNAQGEYIVFCDSDDWIAPGLLRVLNENSKYDVALTSYVILPSNIVRNYPEQKYLDLQDIGQCLHTHIYTGFSMPWAKLFKKSIIIRNSLYFDEKIFTGEDTLWVNQYLQKVRSVKLLSFEGYYYNRDNNNLSRKGIAEDLFVYAINLLLPSYSMLEEAFQTDLTEWKLNVQMYFFHRYVIELSKHSIPYICNKLKMYHQSPLVRSMFYDDKYVLKGLRLCVFNFMMKQRLYFLLSFYVKFQKRYL